MAELPAVSPETVLRKIRTGQLEAIRLSSNALRVREFEFEAYLTSAPRTAATACGRER